MVPWRQLEGMFECLTATAWSTMSEILRPEERLILILIWSMSALHDLHNHVEKAIPWIWGVGLRSRDMNDPRSS